jgi:hypothetical protein
MLCGVFQLTFPVRIMLLVPVLRAVLRRFPHLIPPRPSPPTHQQP